MTSVPALDCPHRVSQRLGLLPRWRERKPSRGLADWERLQTLVAALPRAPTVR